MHSLWQELHGNQASSSCASRSSEIRPRCTKKPLSMLSELHKNPQLCLDEPSFSATAPWNHTPGWLEECFINSGVVGSESPTALDQLSSTVVITGLITAGQVGWIVRLWHQQTSPSCLHVRLQNCEIKLLEQSCATLRLFLFSQPNVLSCISSSQTMDCRPNGLFPY